VFLKQFYDADRSGRVCYMAIVEAELEASAVDVTVKDEDPVLVQYPAQSHPLGLDLGLDLRQKPVLSYFVRCTLETHTGEIVWKA
jgi:hypothetical protein